MLLTEAGILLRKRAQEIIALYEKAESEWLSSHEDVSGEVYIGGGETYGITILMDVVCEMQKTYPKNNKNKESISDDILCLGYLLDLGSLNCDLYGDVRKKV